MMTAILALHSNVRGLQLPAVGQSSRLHTNDSFGLPGRGFGSVWHRSRKAYRRSRSLSHSPIEVPRGDSSCTSS